MEGQFYWVSPSVWYINDEPLTKLKISSYTKDSI